MASDDAVWEWDVASIGELSKSLPNPLFSAGVQGFHFKSRLSRYAAVYLLINAGVGPSFSFKKFKDIGSILKKFTAFEGKTFSLIGSNPHSRFYVDGAFSGDDLHLALGQSYVLGAAAGPGYQLMAISASSLTSNYFRFVNVSGPEIGLDVSAAIKTGLWYRAYETIWKEEE